MDDKTAKKDDSGAESDADHMKGVTEIKGVDTPKAVIEEKDVKQHQDAEDPDAVNNHNGEAAQSASSTPSQPAQPSDVKPEAQPAVQSQPAQQAVAAQPKQSHTLRNCCLIFILLGCFLCIACIGGGYIFRDKIVQLVTTSISRPIDSSLKTVSSSQVQSSPSDLATLLQQKKDQAVVTQGAGGAEYTISFTEAELLTALLKESGTTVDPSAVALKFEQGDAKIRIEVGKLISSMQAQNSSALQSLPVDPSTLSGIILTADVVASPDGTKLMIQNLSTGSSVLDALIPPSALSSLDNQLDLSTFVSNSGSGDQAGINIKKIEFTPGLMTLTIQE